VPEIVRTVTLLTINSASNPRSEPGAGDRGVHGVRYEFVTAGASAYPGRTWPGLINSLIIILVYYAR